MCEEVGICRVQDCSELREDTSGHMDRTKLVRTKDGIYTTPFRAIQGEGLGAGFELKGWKSYL